MFDTKTFKQKLSTQWLGHSLIFLEELESTNSYVKKLPSEKISHGLICLADHQTRGRGQYEKSWVSEKGKNLTFTLTFLPGEVGRFHVLTLACAKAILEQIFHTAKIKGALKWPNDVCLENKKVAGLLTETTFSGNKMDRLMVGIGLNVNQEKFPEEIRESATSIKQMTGDNLKREEFLGDLLGRIEYEYRRWLKRDQDQLKEINQNLMGYGKWVHLSINGKTSDEKAKLIGLNENGQLVVLSIDAELETYSYEQIRIITNGD